jgi:hypothetical protein
MADTNLTALRYVAESTWGTTPSSALKVLRYTSESLADQKQTVESAEIISTRGLREVNQVARSSSGDIGFELAYGAHDDLLEGALGGTWTTNVLTNGVVKRSFTFEKQFTDLTNQFLVARGCRLGSLGINFSLGAIATGTIGMVGKRLLSASATAGTGAPTAAATTSPISTINFTANEGGSPLAGVTEVTMALSNNLRVQNELGSADPFGIGYGGFRASGTLNVYMQSASLIDKYNGHTASNITITVLDDAGNSYVISIPRIRYTSAQIVAGGVNSDVMVQLGWTAIQNTGTTTMFQITRIPV